MVISKSSLAAGILGTGGGAVGTVATVKYVTSTSKQEAVSEQEVSGASTSDQVSSGETTTEQVARSDEHQTELEKARQDILNWVKEENKNCTVKIKSSSKDTEINEAENKDDLTTLLKFLKESNSGAKEKCKSSSTILVEKQTSENETWKIVSP